MSVAVETQTVLAFDSLAAKYDDLFTRSMIGRAQRGVVWDALIDTFEPGAHILELNCGTGEDALFLAGHDVSVLACDASAHMIDTARRRMRSEDPEAPIEFRVLATEQLSRLGREELFDGAFSNFSGLNCVADLHLTAHQLAGLVSRGAPVLICLSTRYCISEMAWFVLHGEFRKAFRRTSGFATVKVGEYTVKVHYPTLRADQEDLFAVLSHAFVHRDRHCRSSFVPGTDRAQASSFAEPASCGRPGDLPVALVPDGWRSHAYPL